MTRKPQKETDLSSLHKLPLVHQIYDIMEVWKVIKEYGRKPTCGEEMGLPDWRQWF
ncbi:MAG: hypothetical protein MI742_00800 [Desulfobacterales bacterium]|nr:hypothetical protein [Desulfobacterales bacterium]